MECRERLSKFGLELHPEKTRLIEFGRYAAERRKKRGEGKPETFDFLGFTHFCRTNLKTGRFEIRRKTIGKRMTAKLKEIAATLQQRRHESIADTLKWLQSVVRGLLSISRCTWQLAAIGRVSEKRALALASLTATPKSSYTLDLEPLSQAASRSDTGSPHFTPYPDARFAAKHPR